MRPIGCPARAALKTPEPVAHASHETLRPRHAGDTVVDVYESRAWRRYTDATGRSDEWLECEFDYFLIACDASYSDVQRLLAWDKARTVDLAAAMESDEPHRRRPLAKASEAWQSPTGTPLTELAASHGWTKQ